MSDFLVYPKGNDGLRVIPPVNDDNLVDSLLQWEGFLPHPKDIGDGKITLGSGLTDPRWHRLYRERGDVWSKEDNRNAVAVEVAKRRKILEGLVPHWEEIEPETQKAFISYYYNYPFSRENSPKMFEAFDRRNFREAVNQMNATSSNPTFKKGLEIRREKERRWGHAGLNNTGNDTSEQSTIKSIFDQTANTVRNAIHQIVPHGASGRWSEGGSLNSPWDGLSLQEKAEMMEVAVRNGITDLKTIREKYNEFAEGGYLDWKEKANKYKHLDIDNDNTYDYEGWYNENPERAWNLLKDNPNAHFDDRYKTIYHPTFSTQSKYSGVRDDRFNPQGLVGGTWSKDGHTFTMSPDGYIGPVSMDDRKWYLENAEDNGVQLREADGSLPIYDGIPWGGVLPNIIINGSRRSRKFEDGGFTSELDWSPDSWFSKRVAKPDGTLYNDEEAARLASHVPEYNNIEQTAKANGTWLKMSDGSTWKGDPRSWVMMQSESYKKNYSPKPWYTGQAEWPTTFDYGKGKVDTNKVTRAPYYNNQMWFSDSEDYGQTFADYQNSTGLGWRFDTPGEEDIKGHNFLSAIPKEGNYRTLESSANGRPDQWQRLPFVLEDGTINRLPESQISVDSKGRNIRADKQKVLTDDVVNWSKDLGDQGIFMQNIDDGAIIKNGEIHRQPVNEFISQPGFTNKVKFIEGNTGDFDIDNPYKYANNFYVKDNSLDNNYAALGGPLVEAAMNEYKSGGKIHIKPENRGKFTRLKERTGHSATWFKEHGTPAQRKMATFALNARHWKHGLGGPLVEAANIYDGTTENSQQMNRGWFDFSTDNVFPSYSYSADTEPIQQGSSSLQPVKTFKATLPAITVTRNTKPSTWFGVQPNTVVTMAKPEERKPESSWRWATVSNPRMRQLTASDAAKAFDAAATPVFSWALPNPFRAINAAQKGDVGGVALEGLKAVGLKGAGALAVNPSLAAPGSAFWTNPITRQVASGTAASEGVNLATNVLTPYSTWSEGVSDVVNQTTGWNPQDSWWGQAIAEATNPGWLVNPSRVMGAVGRVGSTVKNLHNGYRRAFAKDTPAAEWTERSQFSIGDGTIPKGTSKEIKPAIERGRNTLIDWIESSFYKDRLKDEPLYRVADDVVTDASTMIRNVPVEVKERSLLEDFANGVTSPRPFTEKVLPDGTIIRDFNTGLDVAVASDLGENADNVTLHELLHYMTSNSKGTPISKAGEKIIERGWFAPTDVYYNAIGVINRTKGKGWQNYVMDQNNALLPKYDTVVKMVMEEPDKAKTALLRMGRTEEQAEAAVNSLQERYSYWYDVQEQRAHLQELFLSKIKPHLKNPNDAAEIETFLIEHPEILENSSPYKYIQEVRPGSLKDYAGYFASALGTIPFILNPQNNERERTTRD